MLVVLAVTGIFRDLSPMSCTDGSSRLDIHSTPTCTASKQLMVGVGDARWERRFLTSTAVLACIECEQKIDDIAAVVEPAGKQGEASRKLKSLIRSNQSDPFIDWVRKAFLRAAQCRAVFLRFRERLHFPGSTVVLRH
jgi:hypothetical protein